MLVYDRISIYFGGYMKKEALIPSRIRSINGSFGFIPHRFIRGGYLTELNSDELLLYFFLILAADAYGLSYYSDRTISKLIDLSFEEITDCRNSLMAFDLIAYKSPLYQVLELPIIPIKRNHISKTNVSFNRLKNIANRKRK
jgi:hypothetical protein